MAAAAKVGHNAKAMPGPPFSSAKIAHTEFGVLAAVWLPLAPGPLPPGLLSAEEEVLAHSWQGLRQVDFAGGRVAAHNALVALGLSPTPILMGEHGEPRGPPQFSVSLSHKRGLAVALVAPLAAGTVGVDLEGGDDRPRLAIAERVLVDEELHAWRRKPPEERWPSLQRSFSLKEAVYKAIHPHVGRYVGFQECQLTWANDSHVQIEMRWRQPTPSVAIEGRVMALLGYVVSLARARAA